VSDSSDSGSNSNPDPAGGGADPDPDDSWQDRADRALGRLVDASAVERILISVAALVLSVVVGAVVILISGWAATCQSPFFSASGLGSFCYDPVSVYRVMIVVTVVPP